MNRRDRRRAEAAERVAEALTEKDARARSASADPAFEHYRTLYQHAYRKTTDREIGEGYMRGEAARISGVDQQIIHPTGQAVPASADSDIKLSVSYGPQRYCARVPEGLFRTLVTEWEKFARAIAKSEAAGQLAAAVGNDPRSSARQFIFEMIVENRQWDPTIGPLMACAIAWLVSTSPIGVTIGKVHRCAHYEITDGEAPPPPTAPKDAFILHVPGPETAEPPGAWRRRNYRLMLS